MAVFQLIVYTELVSICWENDTFPTTIWKICQFTEEDMLWPMRASAEAF